MTCTKFSGKRHLQYTITITTAHAIGQTAALANNSSSAVSLRILLTFRGNARRLHCANRPGRSLSVIGGRVYLPNSRMR